MTDKPTNPNEPTNRDEAEDEEPAYCSLCGDPVTGSDVFCAGCGAHIGEGHVPSKGE